MRSFIVILFFLASTSGFAQHGNFTFVFLNKKDDVEKLSKEEGERIQEGHMANIKRLAKEGKLLAAGPFEGGGGLFVLNTTSIDTARNWLSTDPGVLAHRWNLEILPYKPRVGSVCAVKEPLEMVMYEFVRFTAIVTKFTAPTYPQIFKRHDDYLKQLVATGNVVTEGIFGDFDGGILIIRGKLQQEVIEADPGVQESLLDVQTKQLWIAKGSFCEK